MGGFFLFLCLFLAQNTVQGRRLDTHYLAGSAKLAIWLMRKNKARGAGCVEPVLVLVFGFSQSQVDGGQCAGIQQDMDCWGLLCSVGEDDELFLNV